MRSVAHVGLLVLTSVLVSACADSDGTNTGEPCVSHYEPVAHAKTWPSLKDAILDTTAFGRVASVRTQARGQDVGAGDHQAVRVIDLLNAEGHRLVQADVWRTDTNDWAAGFWSQCID